MQQEKGRLPMIGTHVKESPLVKAAVLSTASLLCAVAIGFLALVKIPIPGTPVPLTLQTFALLAGAGLLGRGYALQMVGWYLVIGILGAPFFAGGTGGWVHLLGASGGYLVGFFLAAMLVGYLAGKERPVWQNGLVFLAATLAIYIPGLLQLKLVTGAAWPQTLAMGLAPFIVGDIVKAAAAWGGVTLTRRWMG